MKLTIAKRHTLDCSLARIWNASTSFFWFAGSGTLNKVTRWIDGPLDAMLTLVFCVCVFKLGLILSSSWISGRRHTPDL